MYRPKTIYRGRNVLSYTNPMPDKMYADVPQLWPTPTGFIASRKERRQRYTIFGHFHRGRIWAFTLLLSTICIPNPTAASVFDIYGFGARSTSMGNAQTASSEDYFAAYYNPANLISRKSVHFGYGFNYVVPLLSISRRDTSSAIPSLLPDADLGVYAGISAPIGGIFEKKVAFGFAIFLPMLSFTRLDAVDYRKPHFYSHQSLPNKLVILGGIGVQPIEWLRVGLGVQILADLQGAARVDVSLLDNRLDRKDIRVDVFGHAAPTAGLTFVPLDGLNLSLSYRSALSLRYELPIRAFIEEIGTLDIRFSGTSLYTPHQLSVGASWDISDLPLRVAADVTWAMWSLAPSPAADVTLAVDGSELFQQSDPTSPGTILDARSATVQIDARDTLTPRIGFESVPLDWLTARIGYYFSPQRLPVPTQQANYLDANVHTMSLGLGFRFLDPTEHHQQPLTLDLSVQWQLFDTVHVDKPDPNDPVGDYKAGGSIFNFGLDIRHDF